MIDWDSPDQLATLLLDRDSRPARPAARAGCLFAICGRRTGPRLSLTPLRLVWLPPYPPRPEPAPQGARRFGNTFGNRPLIGQQRGRPIQSASQVGNYLVLVGNARLHVSDSFFPLGQERP